MDAQPQGIQVLGLGNPFSIYTADQQETLFEKAVKQANYDYFQANLESTARLTFLAIRLALSTSPPQQML